MKRLLAIIAIIPLLCLTACSDSVPRDEQTKVMEFYQNFVSESSTLDVNEINAAYQEVQEYPEGSVGRDRLLDRFDELNPELFDQIAVEYGDYSRVGATYVKMLQLALATGGREVTVEFPLDAVSYERDEDLDVSVYTIDRSDMTVVIPVGAQNLITEPENRSELPPIRIYKTKAGEYELIPADNTFAEIGTLTSTPEDGNEEQAE